MTTEIDTPQQWLDAFQRYQECRAQPLSKLGWAQELMDAARVLFKDIVDGERIVHG